MDDKNKIANANSTIPSYKPVSEAGKRLWEKLHGSKYHETKDTQLSKDDLFDLIKFFVSGNENLTIYYINLFGFKGNLLNSQDSSKIIRCVHTQGELPSAENIEFALNNFTSKFDDWIRSQYWSMDSDKKGFPQESPEFHRLSEARDKVKWRGIAKTASIANIDLADLVNNFCLESRVQQNEILASALEHSRASLFPVLNRAMAQGRNKYGDIDESKLFDELSEFLDYKFPDGNFPTYFPYKPLMVAYNIFKSWANMATLTDEIPSGGVEFEIWCAEKIREQGWDVSMTPTTGDQGVDLIARRGQTSVAIQCKNYTGAIGNSAVQQIFAGQKHALANFACVIGTGGFTKSAFEIASITRVALINAENIYEFSSKFGFNPIVKPKCCKANNIGTISISLNGMLAEAVGGLFRANFTKIPMDTTGYSEGFRNYLFDAIPVDQKEFEIDVSRIDACRLVVFSSIIALSEVTLDEQTRTILATHNYPNFEITSIIPMGGKLRLYLLWGEELLSEIQVAFSEILDAANYNNDRGDIEILHL